MTKSFSPVFLNIFPWSHKNFQKPDNDIFESHSLFYLRSETHFGRVSHFDHIMRQEVNNTLELFAALLPSIPVAHTMESLLHGVSSQQALGHPKLQ